MSRIVFLIAHHLAEFLVYLVLRHPQRHARDGDRRSLRELVLADDAHGQQVLVEVLVFVEVLLAAVALVQGLAVGDVGCYPLLGDAELRRLFLVGEGAAARTPATAGPATGAAAA